MSEDTRIPDLNPDGSKTGRVLAINPSGHLVGIPESVNEKTLKPGFRFATAADVALKQKQAKAAADKKAAPAPAPAVPATK